MGKLAVKPKLPTVLIEEAKSLLIEDSLGQAIITALNKGYCRLPYLFIKKGVKI